MVTAERAAGPAAPPVGDWPARFATEPGLTLEEILRPFGVSQTLSFITGTGERETISYHQFAGCLAAAARGLTAHGVRPGTAVATTVDTSLPSVIRALAVWTAGGTLVSLPPRPRRALAEEHAQRFRQVLTAMGCEFVMTDRDESLIGPGIRAIPAASVDEAARDGSLSAEDAIEYGDLHKKYQQSTFGAHFVEAGVNIDTGEIRIRRMLAVCAAGRILNPKSARSQVIGAMTMGVGAALMEELVVDKRLGFFVNHDLAGYEVPGHADIPHQDMIFLDETDPMSSPMKAKGVAELGICGVAAAVANAIYNATGVRVRDYPITLDKLIDKLPAVG